MKVDNVSADLQYTSRSAPSRTAPGAGFQGAMAEAAAASTASPAAEAAPSHQSPTEQEQAAATKAKHASLRQELDDYLSKTPEEHMRDAIMKEMGLTEADLAAMPPEKRQATEMEIGRRIKERLLAKAEAHPDAATLAQSALAGSMRKGGAQEVGQSPAGMADFAALQAAVNGTRRATGAA